MRAIAAALTLLALVAGCRAGPATTPAVQADARESSAVPSLEHRRNLALFEAVWELHDADDTALARAVATLDALDDDPLLGREPVDPEMTPRERLLSTACDRLLTTMQASAGRDRAAYEEARERHAERAELFAAVLAGSLEAERCPVTTEELLGLYASTDPLVRSWAAVGLGRHGDPSGLAEIREALAGSDQWQPIWAARAAGHLGPDAAELLPDIARLLAESGPGDVAHGKFWVAADYIAPHAAGYLPEVARGLDSRELPARVAAMSVLEAAGPTARDYLPRLERLVTERGTCVLERAWALGTLASVGSGPVDAEHTAAVLRPYLASDEPELREAATEALSKLGDPACLPEVEKALADGGESRQLQALDWVGYLGERAAPALPAVQRLLSASSRDVRYAAAMAVASIGGAAGAPARADLVRLLADGNPSIRTAGACALACQGDAAAVEVLRPLTLSRRLRVRVDAARALSLFRPPPPEVVALARELLSDEVPSVAGAGAAILALAGDHSGEAVLRQGLRDTSGDDRLPYVEPLAALGDATMAEVLHELAGSGDWHVRQEAARTLAEHGWQ